MEGYKLQKELEEEMASEGKLTEWDNRRGKTKTEKQEKSLLF